MPESIAMRAVFVSRTVPALITRTDPDDPLRVEQPDALAELPHLVDAVV